MLILQFAFADPAHNTHAPHNHTSDNVVYTGTHDNNTSKGWFEEESSSEELSNLILYLGKEVSSETICADMIRMAMSSTADTAVIQMQDYLELKAKSRMNIPSTPKGNWEWRMMPDRLTDELTTHIRTLTRLYGR